MNYKALSKMLGVFWIILALILLIPTAFSFFDTNQHTTMFFLVSICTLIAGVALWFFNRSHPAEISIKTSFAFVAGCWFSAGLIGALPYYFSGTLPTFIDSVFEAVSGITGTGATVLTDIENRDTAILLWRSMTQWLGGIGIIVFFIAILPLLGIAGVQIFKAETTGPRNDSMTPRIKDTAKRLWIIYIALTLLCIGVLKFLGLTWYDAVNHALTCVATGGFSTKDNGIAAFDNSMVNYVIVFFMLVSSISFAFHYRFILLGFKTKLTSELKFYLSIITFSIISIAVILWTFGYDYHYAVESSIFTTVAVVSSTGYTNFDYASWPVIAQFILVLLMVMGGMSGSTAGGVKCIRLLAAFRLLQKELKQVLHPHAILAVKTNDKVIKDNVASAIWGFLFLYLFIFSIIMTVLCLEGLDFTSAGTATIASISNIGPALGEFGPYSNYLSMSPISKLAFTIGMFLGRLEFFAILVLFTRDFWKRY